MRIASLDSPRYQVVIYVEDRETPDEDPVKQCQELQERVEKELINQNEAHRENDETEVQEDHRFVWREEHRNSHRRAENARARQAGPPVP